MLFRAGHLLLATDRLVRLHAVGFLALWPLLGLAATASTSLGRASGILLIAVLFNSFGAVLNDVVDLPVDATNPLRKDSLLVRGAVSRPQALALALAQLPLMAVAHLLCDFPPSSLSLLFGAAAAMGLYDLFSKRTLAPPLIESSQALSGALMVFYGAAVGGGEAGTAAGLPAVVLTAAAAAIFILLINAFHGGLRDIDNDLEHRQRTTPIWLGCGPTIDRRVHVSRPLSIYSGVLQSALLASALCIALYATAGSAGALTWSLVAVSSGLNVLLFWLLHRLPKPTWDTALRLHVLAAPLPVLFAFLPFLGGARMLLLCSVYFAPVLLVDHTRKVLRNALGRRRRQGETLGPLLEQREAEPAGSPGQESEARSDQNRLKPAELG